MDLTYSTQCSYFIENLLKNVHNQTVNKSIQKYVDENIPKNSIDFFNNTENQVVQNVTFKPLKCIEIEQKEPFLKHSRHRVNFVSSEPTTKRASQGQSSRFNEAQLKRGIARITKSHANHKKCASTIQQHILNIIDEKSVLKLIPLFPQNYQSNKDLRKSCELKPRFYQGAKTQQFIESLRLKKKKIEEAFSSFIDPKTNDENNKESQTLKNKLSYKQLLNLQIVTNYDGEIMPIKKSSRRLNQKLLLIPNYRIKTQTNSNYADLPVNIRTHKPFQTFKNVCSSVISKGPSGLGLLKNNNSKMVSILDIKSQKQNISGMISSQIGSKKMAIQTNNTKKIKLQDMISCSRSRRVIQQQKRSKKKIKVEAIQNEQYSEQEQQK